MALTRSKDSKTAKASNASKTFALLADNLARAEKIIAKYPAGRQASAVIPLLEIAQRQNGGWLSQAAMNFVAKKLDMPPVRVYEVATFYSMFNLKPVGKNFVQICTTTPCWLRGSEDIVHACQKKLGINLDETTKDGKFTLREVECLGACVNAPVVQINDDFYEDLTPDAMDKILDTLKAGKKPEAGSQTGRSGSCPQDGSTSLKKKADTDA
ncbi:MAG: NADH-quinone oxidoreductase subunit NuoE [Bdellovibrionales bacterium]|jgi:NADH-quinone oxidoreductase subunit E